MTAKAYVGVTGPVCVEETIAICREFSLAGYSMQTPHIPMLGFLVSDKTLRGQETKNRRYPEVWKIPYMLDRIHGDVFTMIHYSTKEPDSLSDQVKQIFEDIYEEGLCRAMQMNIVWPDIKQVTEVKRRYPEMQLVFQASFRAMEGKSPKELADRISAYGDLIDYALIDPSGGRGEPFDVKSSVAVYSELKQKCPGLRIGFAGGLTGEDVSDKVKEVVEKVGASDFCIDAEGGLRDKITPAYGDDLLNMQKVRAYLQAASLALK